MLEPDERARIHGFIVNKFRGDVGLFDQGLTAITRCTGWPSLGVVPWLPQAAWLPAEDARRSRSRAWFVGRRASSPCRCSPASPISTISIRWAWSPASSWSSSGRASRIPADAELVILPGTKSTIGDLAFLRAQGWDIDIKAHVRRGGHVLGLCGGYQMLGRTIADPDGVDGRAGTVEGLGLLDITTVMTPDKSTTLVSGTHCATGARDRGLRDPSRPQRRWRLRAACCLTIEGRADGASSADGRVQGTYVHGLFTGDAFRKAWLATFRHRIVVGL